MSERAPRPDSKLKNLPEETQEQIIALLKKRKSFESAVQILDAEFGVQTSATALRSFFSWHSLREAFRQREQRVESVIERLAEKRPELSPNHIFDIGQEMFAALAIESENSESWFFTQKLALEKQKLTLARDKFQRDTCKLFLKWFEDKAAKDIASSSESNASKIERLGQLMFGEAWE